MKLREARLSKFLSIRDLATKAGVSPRTIVETESGRQTPYFTTARKLAEALGIAPGDIDEFRARVEDESEVKSAA